MPTNKLVIPLVLTRPQSPEELEQLKRNYPFVSHSRTWEVDEYPVTQMPPVYDMYERRSKYPEYYGDRYTGTLKQNNKPGEAKPQYFARRPQPPEQS